MSMILIVNSVPYNNFLSGEAEIRLDVLCNTFNFIVARSELEPLPFRVGDPCRIEVEGEVILTGNIELMTVNYDESSHTIELAGRDRTSDILDSTLDSLSDIGEGATLKSIIELVIDQIGSDLKVIEEFKTDPFNSVNDIASPEPGDNAFTFLEQLARQRQALLTSDSNGDIVISRGSGLPLGNARLQNTISRTNTDNNIKRATVSYDNTGRYNLYKLTSQGNPSSLGDDSSTDLDSIISRGGGTSDSEIKAGRQLVLSSESSFSDNDDFNRAKWEANIRKARGRLYTVDVFGYTYDDDNLWEINRLVSIVDVFSGIFGEMLINSIAFTINNASGATTKITMVEKDAYSLVLEEPVSGDGFTL